MLPWNQSVRCLNAVLCAVCSSPLLFTEREGVIQLGLLPFYHIYAVMVTFVMSLSWGQTTVVVPGFDPRLFLELVPKYKVGSLVQ